MIGWLKKGDGDITRTSVKNVQLNVLRAATQKGRAWPPAAADSLFLLKTIEKKTNKQTNADDQKKMPSGHIPDAKWLAQRKLLQWYFAM